MTGSFTQSETDTPVIGAGGVITGGSSVETLTSTDTTTQTYSENGSRTVSWSPGNYNSGLQRHRGYDPWRDCRIRPAGFAGHSAPTARSFPAAPRTSSTTSTYSDSESDLESGSEVDHRPRPEAQPLGGSYTQTSVTTSYAYSLNRGTQTFGAGGVVSGGNNSFTFVQTDSDTHNLNVTTRPPPTVVSDSGYDTYSDSMSGTETYGQGGTISGGSDSFTWAQTASDNLIITQAYGGTTLGAYTQFDMTVDDIIYQNFSDVGNDILGPSESILGGRDTYTWGIERDLVSTLTDYGDAATPYLIKAYSSDLVDLSQTGSDTLTTDGHIYSTVTYNYSEQTSDNSTVSESVSGNGGWLRVGSASDSYSTTDSGTITISDTVTTSFDSFAVQDNHSISGSLSTSSSVSGTSIAYGDNGSDSAAMKASGTKSTSAGDNFTFTDTESNTDNFVLNKTILNNMNGVATVTSSQTMSETGGTSAGAYAYNVLTQTVNSVIESGNQTYGTIVSPFALLQSQSLTVDLTISGPTEVIGTVESLYTTSTSGTGANFTETVAAGNGTTAGTPVAGLIGAGPRGSAEHLGTSPNSLDTSSGLLSGLGGEGVAGMSFKGSDILPTANPGGTALWLEESNQSGQTATNWVSHPSGIGYRRGTPGATTWSGSGSHSTSSSSPPIPGNAPTMDSGTSDGGVDQELNRLANFLAGGNQNPTSTQPAGTPRSQQLAMPMLPTGSPAATNLLLTDPDAELPITTLPFHPETDGNFQVTPISDGPSQMTGRRRSGNLDSPSSGVQGGDNTVPGDTGMTPSHNTRRQRKPPSEPDPVKDLVWDLIQMVLDLAGIVDPTGVADASSATMALAGGDWKSALIGVASMIPYVGDAAKAGKLGKYAKTIANAIELAQKNAEFAKALRPLLKQISKLLKKIPIDNLPPSVAKPLRKMQKQIDDFLETATKRPGTRGAPDHQADVNGPGRAQAEAAAQPGEKVLTERPIQGHPGVNRRADNQVIGKDDKTRLTVESERRPNGPYHKKRVEQLENNGIEVQTRPLPKRPK